MISRNKCPLCPLKISGWHFKSIVNLILHCATKTILVITLQQLMLSEDIHTCYDKGTNHSGWQHQTNSIQAATAIHMLWYTMYVYMCYDLYTYSYTYICIYYIHTLCYLVSFTHRAKSMNKESLEQNDHYCLPQCISLAFKPFILTKYSSTCQAVPIH